MKKKSEKATKTAKLPGLSNKTKSETLKEMRERAAKLAPKQTSPR